ncbi:VOC family protein [Paenibacillus silvisoli]|uniref:VOC family protein n=1 Tax=Paenibacillus silvisoli TaxID=3110539 RepID=UPI0028043B08|nr:VOC family protein [Paenibacillus silvisoli]
MDEEIPIQSPPWQGFHHLALVTTNLDETVSFYIDLLGMQLHEMGIRPATPMHGRHAMIKPGACESWGLHFFEQLDAHIYTHPEALQRMVFVSGAMQHISFGLPDEEAALAFRERLITNGVPTTPIIKQGPLSLLQFPDNNGIMLEVIWPRRESA